MSNIFNHISEQYGAVRESRNVLFSYCQTISQLNLVNENSLFGRGGSMRNLLVHIANVYEFWIANNALKKSIPYTSYPSQQSVAEIVALFSKVDIYMNEFIALFQQSENMQIDYVLNGIKSSVSGLKLFTHVITHEFHHKGQILSISRHLGYIPVDTDVIR